MGQQSTRVVAPSRERELKLQLSTEPSPKLGMVAPSRERELKLNGRPKARRRARVAPSRERELKHYGTPEQRRAIASLPHGSVN